MVEELEVDEDEDEDAADVQQRIFTPSTVVPPSVLISRFWICLRSTDAAEEGIVTLITTEPATTEPSSTSLALIPVETARSVLSHESFVTVKSATVPAMINCKVVVPCDDKSAPTL